MFRPLVLTAICTIFLPVKQLAWSLQSEDRLLEAQRSTNLLYGSRQSGTPLTKGQEDAVLSFEEVVWDFGYVKEADGVMQHTFRFTNNSSSPVIIERVISDCGCTSPGYSREPVKPGMDGAVEITFNPANFSGAVTKSVTVFCNNGRSRNLLTIKANVIEKRLNRLERYPVEMASGVRADNLHVAFGYVENGSANSRVVELVNTSKKKVKIAVISATGGGRLIAAVPAELPAGEIAAITLTYDMRKTGRLYGMITDMVHLSIDGKRCELPIVASAIAVDDFGRQEADRAPGCLVMPAFHNFGEVKSGQVLSVEVTISNTGKSPLIIRNIAVKRHSSTSLVEDTVIAPGKNKVFSVSLDTAGRSGAMTGGITIIVNEPHHPMREIRLAAEIVE